MKTSERDQVVILIEIRRELGLKDGDTVMRELADGEARLTTRAARIKRAQAMVRQHVPAKVSLADELIAGRRREARRALK